MKAVPKVNESVEPVTSKGNSMDMTTKRLQELEKNRDELDQTTEIMAYSNIITLIEGYYWCLADLWPVVEKARAVVAHEHQCTYSHRMRAELRDALAAVEVQDD